MGALPATPERSAADRDWLRAGLFALAYFAGGELGYSLSLGPSVGATFWPPAGIALAVFLVAPRRTWPLLIVAGVLANLVSDVLHGQRLPASIGFAIANLGEPLLGAFLLRRVLAEPITFSRLTQIGALAAVVVLVSAPFGAAIGAVTAERWTTDPPGFLAGWITWWVGDAVGALVLTPCVLRVMQHWQEARAVSLRTWSEVALYLVILVAITQVIFAGPWTSLAMPFLVFPVILWGSLRFGPIGVGGALCLVVLLATHDTAAGQGPFAPEHLSFGERLIALQIYVGVMAITFYAMAVLWEERARTAAALRSAHLGLEARYRRIVEQSPLAILVVQPDGAVREVNPAWQRLLQPPAARDAGVAENRLGELLPLLAPAFAGDVVELAEREIPVAPDGGLPRRRVRGVAYPVKDEADKVVEVVVIQRDITEERETQQQLLEANRTLRDREEVLSRLLRQMEEAQAHREQLLSAERFARGEAERASKLKDEFLATLSHELRTPLNAIVGWAHILRQSPNGPTVPRAVETIERNARAQAKLIDELLDMSRITAGKMGLMMARAPLGEIATAAVDALRPSAASKGIALSIDVAEAPDVWVLCDPARLQQVMTNLLTNGIKFTPAGGRVEARVASSQHEAHFIVRDTGEGIPPEFLPAVFERFRQADGSSTRRHGGLGLGLSIARHIVEMHGGLITAQSDGVGHGATFAVTLPRAGEVLTTAPDTRHNVEVIALDGVSVLVVDDEADARELLARLLTERGCDVSMAASAEAALAELAKQPYELLLTDIGMPGMDGYELLRRVRADGKRLPRAIAVTAFARPQDRTRALAAGFDGHLAKPLNPTKLLQTVEQIVGAARRVSEAARADARSDGALS